MHFIIPELCSIVFFVSNAVGSSLALPFSPKVEDFGGQELVLILMSWLNNGRRYKQYDHCNHDGLS